MKPTKAVLEPIAYHAEAFCLMATMSAMPDAHDISFDDARLRAADYRMRAEELRCVRHRSVGPRPGRASSRSRRHTTHWRRPLRASQRGRRGPGRHRKGEGMGREASRVPVGCGARLD